MSALPPKADIQSSSSDVRFVPKIEIGLLSGIHRRSTKVGLRYDLLSLGTLDYAARDRRHPGCADPKRETMKEFKQC